MKWQVPQERVVALGLVLAGGIGAQMALRNAGFHAFAATDMEGFNVLILLVGGIYSVLLAFAIFVIWGQFTETENCVMREASALDDLLRFSRYLGEESRARLRRSVADYVHHALKVEWSALADGRKDHRAEEVFDAILDAVVEASPGNPTEQAVYVRLLDLAQRAGSIRDERVARSITRMPPTLAALVNTIASVLLLFVFAYPFVNQIVGAVCFGLVASVLFLANFVMMDTDNPLSGTFNISSRPFAELRP
jgi:hypothetical protein